MTSGPLPTNDGEVTDPSPAEPPTPPRSPFTMLGGHDAVVCTDESCEIPAVNPD